MVKTQSTPIPLKRLLAHCVTPTPPRFAQIRPSVAGRRPPQIRLGALRRTAVSVIGGPGLAVRAAAGVQAALHGTHAAHPHGLVECVAFVLEGRQVEICNKKR